MKEIHSSGSNGVYTHRHNDLFNVSNNMVELDLNSDDDKMPHTISQIPYRKKMMKSEIKRSYNHIEKSQMYSD